MKLAFALHRYFPYGGLQRDMLAIAREAMARGHDVTVVCNHWEGDCPEGLKVDRVTSSPWFDVAGVRRFVCGFREYLKEHTFDLVVGFNKMPGLDIYYAGDSCFAYKAYRERHWLYRFAPRSQLYLSYERAVYGAGAGTQILELSDRERCEYRHYYGTEPERFCPLPPGLETDHVLVDDPAAARACVRGELGIGEHEPVLLCLGSGFRTKGLDRSLRLLAELCADGGEVPHLLVVGRDRPARYRYLARRLGVAGRVHFLGGREDIGAVLQASDMLLHPAYKETAGTALLEAMLAGKPVLTTDVCGYAHYISEEHMGQVLGRDWRSGEAAEAARRLLAVDPAYWQARARRFAAREDIFSRPRRAVEAMEQWQQPAGGRTGARVIPLQPARARPAALVAAEEH